jgi:hypothetical protein
MPSLFGSRADGGVAVGDTVGVTIGTVGVVTAGVVTAGVVTAGVVTAGVVTAGVGVIVAIMTIGVAIGVSVNNAVSSVGVIEGGPGNVSVTGAEGVTSSGKPPPVTSDGSTVDSGVDVICFG